MASTSARALKLLSVLGTGVVMNSTELAARLGVSERTVRRDIETLRELGYSVEPLSGIGGGYRLGGGSRLPPLVFDEDQVVAIAVALQTATSVLAGIGESSARALETVRQVMPERLRLESDALTVTSVPNYWEFPAEAIDAALVREIGAAVRRRHLLRAEYRSDHETERVHVEPHRIIVWAARWYLVAWDLERDGWRVLRLDRLVAKDPTWVAFADRGLDAQAAEKIVKSTCDRGDSLAGWPCQGSAVLRVAPQLAAEFAPGGAVVEYVDDSTSRLRMGAWSWIGLAGLFITFAADLSQVEPKQLRDAFAHVRERLGSL